MATGDCRVSTTAVTSWSAFSQTTGVGHHRCPSGWGGQGGDQIGTARLLSRRWWDRAKHGTTTTTSKDTRTNLVIHARQYRSRRRSSFAGLTDRRRDEFEYYYYGEQSLLLVQQQQQSWRSSRRPRRRGGRPTQRVRFCLLLCPRSTVESQHQQLMKLSEKRMPVGAPKWWTWRGGAEWRASAWALPPQRRAAERPRPGPPRRHQRPERNTP